MTLQRPAAWRGDRTPLSVVFVVALLAAAVPCVIKAVRTIASADLVTAAVALTTAVALVAAACSMILIGITQSISFREKQETGSILLLPDAKVQFLYYLCFLSGAISSTLFAIFVPRKELSFHFSDGRQIFYPIWAGIIAALLLIPLARSLRREGMCYVRLSPDHLRLDDGYSSIESSWADLKEITDSTPKSKGRRLIVLAGADGSVRSFNAAAMFTPGGIAMYWMIRHYWEHPEDRTELADRRASERLVQLQFGTT